MEDEENRVRSIIEERGLKLGLLGLNKQLVCGDAPPGLSRLVAPTRTFPFTVV